MCHRDWRKYENPLPFSALLFKPSDRPTQLLQFGISMFKNLPVLARNNDRHRVKTSNKRNCPGILRHLYSHKLAGGHRRCATNTPAIISRNYGHLVVITKSMISRRYEESRPFGASVARVGVIKFRKFRASATIRSKPGPGWPLLAVIFSGESGHAFWLSAEKVHRRTN